MVWLRRELIARCSPNPGHRALADWAIARSGVTLVTQNVDGFTRRLRRTPEPFPSSCTAHCIGSGALVARTELKTERWWTRPVLRPFPTAPNAARCSDPTWFGSASRSIRRYWIERSAQQQLLRSAWESGPARSSNRLHPCLWPP